ncbi:FT-interacting protein 4-like [Impatiens glandulifera]|uniref:FT-interacting protein 4-like n=1 Tax=Impatiens glandulifera TaxID=253017 RepID=UPI001FB17DA6|nr:FT-interacting protein 4-like [Impatiens glandulifera]
MYKPPPLPAEFATKATSPRISGSGTGNMFGRDKFTSTHDLVEQMDYLFVRIVKAKELDRIGGCDPYVEVKLGNYKGTTKHFEKKSNPEWNEVFAFSQDQLQATSVEIVVKDKDLVLDDFIGRLQFELIDTPKRIPPDSPLAPVWHRLEDKQGNKIRTGEIMLAIWRGTQADEAFTDAWHSDAVTATKFENVARIRGKVYHAPKLWYVRVNVIGCQDLIPNEKGRVPDVCVQAIIGNQILRTKPSKGLCPLWNEDLLFVAAEPFEEQLILIVEDKIENNKNDVLGKCAVRLQTFPKRLDNKPVPARWQDLEKHHAAVEGEKAKKFASKIHLRVCLEGGYHVLDESINYISDTRPTARQLWKPSIGLLELGIISATGLPPMKQPPATDAFCVAKYGQKWVRTRTIINSSTPRWNEQYTWEVYDPCTVLTIGVFDNGHLNEGGKDSRIGKVRIRLSTLTTGRVYTHSYPLIVLHSSGVKKMGEIQLAVRFSCTSFVNMIQKYTQPIFPKMHYVHQLPMQQVTMLRNQATLIVSARLSRAEPPLKKEVVDYMLDVGSNIWSIRKAKANFFRVLDALSAIISVAKWFDQVCHWKNPLTTSLIHALFLILVTMPETILPTICLFISGISVWKYFKLKPSHPPHMDIHLSQAHTVGSEEHDEELDTFPTTKGPDIVRVRYDRMRSIGGKIQGIIGDFANQCERFHSLVSWRDPRASALFLVFCLVAAVILYAVPFQVVVVVAGLYVFRHPKLRRKLPPIFANYFKRLPSKSDCML